MFGSTGSPLCLVLRLQHVEISISNQSVTGWLVNSAFNFLLTRRTDHLYLLKIDEIEQTIILSDDIQFCCVYVHLIFQSSEICGL